MFLTLSRPYPLLVLIDTWWNVNFTLIRFCACSCWVLIDTWWNVNLHLILQEDCITDVLIDTWWNVNLNILSIIIIFFMF